MDCSFALACNQLFVWRRPGGRTLSGVFVSRQFTDITVGLSLCEAPNELSGHETNREETHNGLSFGLHCLLASSSNPSRLPVEKEKLILCSTCGHLADVVCFALCLSSSSGQLGEHPNLCTHQTRSDWPHGDFRCCCLLRQTSQVGQVSRN